MELEYLRERERERDAERQKIQGNEKTVRENDQGIDVEMKEWKHKTEKQR